jgi:TonB family protein
MFWIAFVVALAIHIGAVALAKNKLPVVQQEQFTGVDGIIDVPEPEPAPLEQSLIPSRLEQIHPDQEVFREENYAASPVRRHHGGRPTSLTRGTTPLVARWMKAMISYAPRPVYPYQARRQRLTGSGVALIIVDQTSGAVTDVSMTQSCGHPMLDTATLDALRRWRFKAGSATNVQVPITYTLTGAWY